MQYVVVFHKTEGGFSSLKSMEVGQSVGCLHCTFVLCSRGHTANRNQIYFITRSHTGISSEACLHQKMLPRLTQGTFWIFGLKEKAVLEYIE